MFSLKDLFAILVSLLFVVVAMATTVQADETMATKADQKSNSQTAEATKTADDDSDVDERDYYTRRAKQLLDSDGGATDSKPHPLTANYPEHYVVVCTGGCRNRQAHIVDFEARKTDQAVEIGEMIPTAAGSASTELGPNTVRCLAGCRSGNTVFSGTTDLESFSGAGWESNTTPQTSKSESGRWMTDKKDGDKS